jgi:hypothetical protein
MPFFRFAPRAVSRLAHPLIRLCFRLCNYLRSLFTSLLVPDILLAISFTNANFVLGRQTVQRHTIEKTNSSSDVLLYKTQKDSQLSSVKRFKI